MVKVVDKNTGKYYNVYDITYDQCGYPKFLIYDDGQWLQRSAKYFKPIDDEKRIIKSKDGKHQVAIQLLHS